MQALHEEVAAYMRHYKVAVPADCTVSNTTEGNRRALELMKKILKADLRTSRAVRFL